MATFNQVLGQYVQSSDFVDGIVSATKASWSGSGYSVELFEDGTWRNLWNNQIGNKYETPGIILSLPTLPEEDTAEVDEEEVVKHDQALRDLVEFRRDELVQELRNTLAEATNG